MSNASTSFPAVLIAVTTGIMLLSGCNRIGLYPSQDKSEVEVTVATFQQRAQRRAYDGAPPVIPHAPLGATCTKCHTRQGSAVPTMGFAPASPHGEALAFQNCRQCHLFAKTESVFAANRFEGLPQTFEPASRAYPGAPPVMPHADLLRDNCLACHAGPAARPEIRCSHPERSNCRQCHVAGAD